MYRDVCSMVEVLRRGGIVCFPTETVYAIASGLNREAIDRIYRLKLRDKSKPMAALFADLSWFSNYVSITDEQQCYISHWYKSPVTFVLNAMAGDVCNLIGDDIGVRVPNHCFALQALRLYGMPIVATSANISGDKSPSSFIDIDHSIIRGVDLVINDDTNVHGVHSTVIDIRSYPDIRLLREGAIGFAELLV